MRNKKFILHKALADAYYTLFMKRKKLNKYLEKLDINFNIEKGRAFYKEYRDRYKSLEDAFKDLKVVDRAYKEGVTLYKVKGSKEDVTHGAFCIHFCEYAIIEEGIISICEELEVPYNKVKEDLYRLMQMYYSIRATDIANPSKSKMDIYPFMEGVLRKQWFHNAFSKNTIDLLSTIIKNNTGKYIDERYIVNKTIW